MNDRPIGLFDSSLGGLTVYKEVKKILPNESYIYFGDTGRSPYGSRPESELKIFVKQIIQFMQKNEAKAIIIACNTVTALGLEQLSKEYRIPLIGVSRVPELTASTTRNKRVGVIGTEITVRSGLHKQAILHIDPAIQVFYKACPQFTPILNSGDLAGKEARDAVEEYLTPLKAERIDTLVLGCTAFPFLLPVIRDFMGEGVTIIDPAAETAMQLFRCLKQAGRLHKAENPTNKLLFSEPDIEKIRLIASKIINVDDCRFQYYDMSQGSDHI
ncbi:glutamate racemase [Sporomusa termitida]|uniref:Glutamate racemase n=1 Tax=Sporomusa termitida TaxID=2377 RepID=A0A517DR11_9FIRM|nr:glutamate racemase [Sporomusa termitida]QDR79804.1 Glutamate racemase [Sporomusa termitida]